MKIPIEDARPNSIGLTPMRRRSAPPFAFATAAAGVIAVAGGLAGCAPSWFIASADQEVESVLDSFTTKALADREEWVRYPEPITEAGEEGALDVEPEAPSPEGDDPEAPAPEDTAPAQPPIMIDLAGALNRAFEYSREFETQVEGLYLQGLGYTLTRFNFGPILDSTISYLWSDQEDEDEADSFDVNAGVSQILPTGGDLSLDGSLSGSRIDDPTFFELNNNSSYSSDVQVNLRQPLLRGAGYEVSHEALTQAQRSLVYAVRDFELFREDFAILVANRYFGLVSQLQQLQNDEQNYRDAVFDRQKAEALRQVDRNRDEDVFIARRREIEAEDALLQSRTNYELALDDFKILIGLPTSAELDIVQIEPEFEPVRVEPDSAVDVALHNRLDLHTQRDQVEDAARDVRIARNGLLPDLDLALGYGYDGFDEDIEDAGADEWSSTVGVTFDVPLQRKAERNRYRASLISLEQAQRALERTIDEISRDVLNQLRELEQFEKRIDIQEEQILQEERAVAVMEIRVESGDADTRDLSDARRGLTDARNALINLKVQHFIGRLQLRRDLGILFIGEDGMWLP